LNTFGSQDIAVTFRIRSVLFLKKIGKFFNFVGCTWNALNHVKTGICLAEVVQHYWPVLEDVEILMDLYPTMSDSWEEWFNERKIEHLYCFSSAISLINILLYNPCLRSPGILAGDLQGTLSLLTFPKNLYLKSNTRVAVGCVSWREHIANRRRKLFRDWSRAASIWVTTNKVELCVKKSKSFEIMTVRHVTTRRWDAWQKKWRIG